jgi:hypothetical protein
MRIKPHLVAPVLLLSAAAPAPPVPPATKPAALVITLIANKDSYPLNPAQSGKAFRDQLAANRGRAPAPSAVDLTLRFTNNTAAPITIPFGGDDSTLHLKLAGEGAVNISNNVPMTMEFRSGKTVTLKPGDSHELKITALAGGARGISEYSYYTEPGAYTLTATFRFSTPNSDQLTVLSSEPLKFKVTKE